jgi:hypothetical protein
MSSVRHALRSPGLFGTHLILVVFCGVEVAEGGLNCSVSLEGFASLLKGKVSERACVRWRQTPKVIISQGYEEDDGWPRFLHTIGPRRV